MPKIRHNEDASTRHQQKRKHKSMQELIAMIAESSKYHKFEVEDIMMHLVGNVQILLASGEPVKLPGLGTFNRRRVKPRVYYSPLLEKHFMLYTSDSVSFKPDWHLQRVMKKARQEGTDKQAYLLWIQELEDEGKVPKGTYELALEAIASQDQKVEIQKYNPDTMTSIKKKSAKMQRKIKRLEQQLEGENQDE